MTKRIIPMILAVLIPVSITIGLVFVSKMVQPSPALCSGDNKSLSVDYINPEDTHYLTGNFDCIPGKLLSPKEFELIKSEAINCTNLDFLHTENCLFEESYISTSRFYLKLSGEYTYTIMLPGHFCNYIMYCNGIVCSSAGNIVSKDSLYPSPKYITLPYTDSGEYEIVIAASSPHSAVTSSYGSILLATSSELLHTKEMCENVSFIVLAFTLVTIGFWIIQLVVIKLDNQLIAFCILVLSYILKVLISDDVVITVLVPNLSYVAGIMLSALAWPLINVALMYFEYTLFKNAFPKKLLIGASLVCLIPFINTLTFSQFDALVKLSIASDIIPILVCLYVVINAFIKKSRHCALFFAGVITIACGRILDYVTAPHPISARYTYTFGLLVLSTIEIMFLARKYASQEDAEIYYASELKRTLEAMQVSENAFLNAQMKPHFLYNTLNTIADLCVTDPEKAKKLITDLKEYLQMVLTLDNMESTVPLSHELTLASLYADIEKQRFPNISFFKDYPIRMPRIDIPPLIIQPLVENAIKHGVRKSEKPGIITIRIVDTYSEVNFQISDNGPGMEQEKINRMFVIPKENSSIGIYNIDKRLKNIYGKGLTVESTVGLGTCISFSIPK